jgi:hypothetical protein
MRIQELRESGLILFEAISGSRAYGTNKPTSDTDYRGVYLAPLHQVMGFNYQDQVNDDTNDTVFYELKRFLDLVAKQNPNILEMLYMPEDCIITRHPLLDELFENRQKFLTKTCLQSFAGYAVSQIKKAKGLNKKINNPQPVKRETPLDYCYFMEDGKSVPARDFLKDRGYDQKYCGLVALNHMRFTYAVYYDRTRHLNDTINTTIPTSYDPYKGIIQSEELSNDVSLSAVPKHAHLLGYMVFNRDAYEVHCRVYKEYQEWVLKRNPDRYQVTIENGNDYDAKNMMHCIRLIRVAREIATDKIINVRRPDREELMFIRNGQAKYDELIAEADRAIAELDGLYAASDLPEHVDRHFMTELLLNLRRKAYNL